ncbi:recombinase family protein [Undibacterium sp. Di26W]|uniref:recombinase family protein n=1 Tax=Undibacterium sp. Di26W TaxID=3413035 RepID=UPI003BF3BC72
MRVSSGSDRQNIDLQRDALLFHVFGALAQYERALTKERVTAGLAAARRRGRVGGRLKDDSLLQYLAPLGWENINLTGDYVWRQNRKIDKGKFRALRTPEKS